MKSSGTSDMIFPENYYYSYWAKARVKYLTIWTK